MVTSPSFCTTANERVSITAQGCELCSVAGKGCRPPAHPAERLSVVALDHLDQIAAHARSLLETHRRRRTEMSSRGNELDRNSAA